MSRAGLLCLILASLLVIQAAAADSKTPELNQVADPPVAPAPAPSGFKDGAQVTGTPAIRRLAKHHADRSVAGGDVIIGGLVTALFAAVFCYIRVTRKRDEAEAH